MIIGEDELLIYLVIGALIMGFIGIYVSDQKNRSGWEGFLFGFFLSIVGVIIVALLPTIEEEEPAELTDERRKEMELKAEALKEKDYPLMGWIFWFIIVATVIAILIMMNNARL